MSCSHQWAGVVVFLGAMILIAFVAWLGYYDEWRSAKGSTNASDTGERSTPVTQNEEAPSK